MPTPKPPTAPVASAAQQPSTTRPRQQARPKPPIAMIVMTLMTLIPSILWGFALKQAAKYPYPSSLQNSSVVLLTAHPDDEAMFFGPTIHKLLRENNTVSLLCFSTGDNDGIGHIRTKELFESLNYFTKTTTANVTVEAEGDDEITEKSIDITNKLRLLDIIDEPKLFPDSMTVEWDTKEVQSKILEVLREKEVLRENSGPVNILTFDSYGISGHINHKALYTAANALVHDPDLETKLNLWVLKSVPIYRKYLYVVDAAIQLFLKSNNLLPSVNALESISTTESVVIVSETKDYSDTYAAMSKAYKSQMKWFRYLWMVFSRYMVVNDIYRIL